MRRRLALWSLSLVVVGCRAVPPRAPGEAAEPAQQPTPLDAKLLAVADAVDPGPQQPLMSTLPQPLRAAIEAKLGARPDARPPIQAIREALAQWDKRSPADGRTQERLLALGLGLVLAERAVAAGSDDVELLLALARTYNLLDVGLSLSQRGLLQLAQDAIAAAVRSDGESELDVGSLHAVLEDMSARLGPLHRHTAARILREHGDHPEATRVLVGLAEDAQRREQFSQASAWLQLAVARSDERTTARAQLELAQACYRSLDRECGDAALARGRAFSGDPGATAEHAAQLARAVYFGEAARRAAALSPDASQIDAGLELAHLMLRLERVRDAQARFEALRAAFPQDARPYAGLAKLEVQRSLDFKAAAAQVELGQRLAHKDREFYEVALGTVGVTFVYQVLPRLLLGDRDALAQTGRMLTDLRGHAEGFRQFEPARAAVVELLLASVEVLIQDLKKGAGGPPLHQVLRGLPGQIAPLAAKYPDSADVRRIVELAAHFDTDADAALKAVSAPLPPALAGDPALQRSRVVAWFNLTLAWERVDQLVALTEAVQTMAPVEGDRVQPTLLAALTTLAYNANGERELGERAVRLYLGLAEQGNETQRNAAQNNAGVLQVALGEVREGILRVHATATAPEADKVALMNVAAVILTSEGAQRPDYAPVFAHVGQEGESAAVRLQADAWQYVQAQRGIGDVELARAQFLAALSKQRAAELRGSTPLGRWGVVANESLPISFYYSTVQGFGVMGDLEAAIWWLIVPSPAMNELVRSAAPAKPKPRRRTGAGGTKPAASPSPR